MVKLRSRKSRVSTVALLTKSSGPQDPSKILDHNPLKYIIIVQDDSPVITSTFQLAK